MLNRRSGHRLPRMTNPDAPSRWICDTCNDEITDPERALLLFLEQDDLPWLRRDFRIVHKSIEGRRCDPGSAAGYSSSIGLTELLGMDGLNYLLSFLSVGPLKDGGGMRVEDMDGFVDLVRRLQVPNYEQARRRFGESGVMDRYSGSNELLPYTQWELAAVVGMPYED